MATRSTTQADESRPINAIVLLIGAMILALALRLVLLPMIVHPGIADPNHYFNMGLRLLDGQGFTIDYIWQYNVPPASIVHPEEHWMPLVALIAAGSMALFGTGVHAALLPFLLLGVLLVPLGYAAARQFGCQPLTSVFIGACAGLLPELTLASLRTDTTIVATILVGISLMLMTHGIRRGHALAFVGSGIAAGLAYLTRNDGALLLPAFAVTLVVYALWGKGERHSGWLRYLLLPLLFAIVIAPWIARNLEVIGTATTPEADDMFFFTDHSDHYAYGRHFTLETMLAAQTPSQIINKRVFEAAAAVQVAYTAFDQLLPVAVIGGLLLLIAARDRQRWLTLAPVLIMLLGLFVAYPLLIPYKSQAGSFKKAYLALVPLLLPLAGYALERAITDRSLRTGAMLLTLAFLAANAFQMVRLDARATSDYLNSIEQVAAVARSLPDRTGDGDIVLMTQDPYMLRFVGVRSVMFPSESRDVVIEVARRYGIDYLLMPAARPSLDPLLLDDDLDPRFIRVAELPGTTYAFYAIAEDAGA
ncbi:MAG: glycosyltransferase family 39 protein [Anaerolineae bacterium]|nr:glycosyltransferase family 39 protein [Anaerolineae bacterium]